MNRDGVSEHRKKYPRFHQIKIAWNRTLFSCEIMQCVCEVYCDMSSDSYPHHESLSYSQERSTNLRGNGVINAVSNHKPFMGRSPDPLTKAYSRSAD
jgi:hypothetical protein